jgi:hypothetical protein
MHFTPKPQNDFPLFMRTYYDRCRQAVPRICAIAAKWAFEDLIPGLSDFDTRFIFSGNLTAPEWNNASDAIGHVHAEMCREFPHWARNLEHLPGINLTLAEITDPRFYYPEFQQWTFYEGDPGVIESIREALLRKQWSDRDELYHLKKFALYCGPYQRGIDPPVNLGRFESKYPLHSRYMHYFTPPVQAAVSLHLRRNCQGKLEALRHARRILPNPAVIDRLFDAIQRHYELPMDYDEPRLSELECDLEAYLQDAWASLKGHVTLLDPSPADRPSDIRKKVSRLHGDPLADFLESAKFGRLLKGRLQFYAESIPHFDCEWVVQNELKRSAANFYCKPLSIYARLRFNENCSPDQTLARLRKDVLTPRECDGLSRFAEIVEQAIPPGQERIRAQQAADAFPPVLAALEKLTADLLQRTPKPQTLAYASH